MIYLKIIPKNKTQLAELIEELKHNNLLNEHWLKSDQPDHIRKMFTANFNKFNIMSDKK
jgi:hypothetical protein